MYVCMYVMVANLIIISSEHKNNLHNQFISFMEFVII